MLNPSIRFSGPLDFREASLSLRDLLAELQGVFSSLNFGNFGDLGEKSWKGWLDAIERYKKAVRQMPKAFRRHPLVRRSLQEIESFETEFRRFRTKVRDYSLPDFQEWCVPLSLKARRAVSLVAELEASPLVQKILRGETLLSSKKTLQWRRKLTHVTMGLTFLYLFVYSGFSKTLIWGITAPFIALAFSLEIARHLNPRVNRQVLRLFGPIMREGENEKINAAMFYILSMGIVYFVFPLEVAMLTLLFIAVGDPIAGIVGSYWGRRRISAHASWEGSIACLLTCAGLAALSAGKLFSHPLVGWPLAGFSLLSGLTGALAEASLKKLDDNLVMPLLSAPVLWVLMKVFSIAT